MIIIIIQLINLFQFLDLMHLNLSTLKLFLILNLKTFLKFKFGLLTLRILIICLIVTPW